MELNFNENNLGILKAAALVTTILGAALNLLHNMAVTENSRAKIEKAVEEEVKKALEK